MFDVLTYQKGGSLLRMLEQYLGVEGFRQGISLYLKTHAYGNTETGDLWDAIEKANPSVPVRSLMDSWIWQPGYPLISARLNGAELVLNQQRFAYDRHRRSDDVRRADSPVDRRSRIEAAARFGASAASRCRPPTQRSSSMPAATDSCESPTTTRCAPDSVATRSTSLTVIDRYNLVDDAWNAVISGRLAAADFLGFVEAFQDERDLAVWQAIARRTARSRPPGRRAGVRGVATPHRRSRPSGRRRSRLGTERGRVRPHLQAPRPDRRRAGRPGQRRRGAGPLPRRC